jgi:hypothetical protein
MMDHEDAADKVKTYVIYFVPHRGGATWTSKQATSKKAVLDSFNWTETDADAILAVYPESNDPGAGNRDQWAQDLKDGAEEMANITQDYINRL